MAVWMLVACRAEYGRCELRAWLLVVAVSLLLVVVVVARQGTRCGVPASSSGPALA